MRNDKSYSILISALCFAAAAAFPQQQAAQQQERMTARDMFYSAAGLVVPVKETKPSPPKVAPSPRKKSPPQGVPKSLPPSTGPRQPEQEVLRPPTQTPQTAGAVLVSSTSAVPLGLRYSILKLTSEGKPVEVDSDSVFRSGDRIRLTVQSNGDAYLYIVQQGSSGNWNRLFPDPEISGGNNFVQRNRLHEIPSGHAFRFDEQAGEEKLFIVLSRQPEPDLDKLIYSLRYGQEATPSKQPGGEKEPERMTLAQNIPPIDDELVSRIRAQVFARDLVFEKVDENAPGEKKEKAVYVVNRTGSAESRVVVDVALTHR